VSSEEPGNLWLSAENDDGEGGGIENDIEDINEHESTYERENEL
jgi:hypothetical protein